MGSNAVAPFAGAWIEIIPSVILSSSSFVAPFAGAWIEIYLKKHPQEIATVAPFAGAWIEILTKLEEDLGYRSLPSRERGLKYQGIDITESLHRRSLRGSVD